MLHTTKGRIAITLVVSLLIHLVLLFVPWVQLPPVEEPELPPLTAKLVALPKVVPVKPASPSPKPRPKPPKPKPVPSERLVPIDEVVSDVLAASSVDATSSVAAVSAVEPVVAAEVVPASPSHPALPKHAQLRFIIYKGKDFQVGEAKHRFEITEDQHYSIKVGMSTTGIVSLFKTYDSEQISSGTIDAQGLRPDSFTENKRTGSGKESFGAKFNWIDKTLSFSEGNQVALPAHTQDLLSSLYQVSQLALEKGTISVPYTNGRKLEYIQFEVGEEVELSTRLGTLRALPLRKVHAAGEEGLEIWLGLEYRLLPIKFSQIDRAGQVAAEMVIAEIRVKD
ncbi:MAG: DUF3108 domain-containing protein [Gallionella sp.]|nr:DUF3108 domain-containing protein [Gallionella sp.]MDD4957995.1 DUF3108 domain-containing protein [Gallionella sp.]